jgi:hypothetical protein
MSMVLTRHETRTLRLPARGIRLGVVADTHSRPHPNALQLLTAQKPAFILHAGDIGDLAVLDALENVAPLIVVRGNIDTRAHHLADSITLQFESPQALLRIYLTHIAVARTRLRTEARERAQAEQADMVICGHSHVPLIAQDGPVAVFNPGSIGPRRFRLPITFGIADIHPQKGVSLHHIDCETGVRWQPVPLHHPKAN